MNTKPNLNGEIKARKVHTHNYEKSYDGNRRDHGIKPLVDKITTDRYQVKAKKTH